MAYDELYDGDLPRLPYHKQLLAYSRLTVSERKRALKTARACVNGDAHFLPLIRMMSAPEYQRIVAGVRQRGRALQMFLTDHYIGGRSYERARVLTKTQVEQMKSRYNVSPDTPALRPQNIQFWYAPDIIRGEDGEFRVIEDNVGFVGGIGDLEALAEASGALGVPVRAARHPRSFYRDMVASYRREARSCGGGKTILLSYPQSQRTNREDGRLKRALGESVTAVTNFRTLKVHDDGLFHLGERVGFVIINMRSEDIEPISSSPYRVSRFWQAVSKGQLGVSFAPGLEFIGDKQFCSSVEALVEFYLNEICLLPSLPILSLSNARSLQKMRKEREQWVIKSCRGQSGESVWVGQHLASSEWTTLLSRVAKKPRDFIAQKYCEPSQFLGRDVDLRPIAFISAEGERVSPIAWGRAAKGKRSKTNIARGGLLAPVVVC